MAKVILIFSAATGFLGRYDVEYIGVGHSH